MEKFGKWYKTFLCCAVSASVGAAVIFAAFFAYFGGSEGVELAKKLNAVRNVIQETYVGEADTAAMGDAAAAAMVDAVNDRWSYYMDAESYEAYLENSANSTRGIGVTVYVDGEIGGIPIQSVVEGGPADRAGVKPGHVILSVAGQSTAEMSLEEVRSLIRSQTGEYEMGLMDENGTEYSVSLENEVVYTNPVKWEMLPDGVGHIVISNFQSGAAEETVSAIEAMAGQGLEYVIFDVRSNPGGQLTELTELLDYILPEGEIFISVSKDGEEEIYTSGASCIDYPMAVLINSDSYSAAEFFAAALREYDCAVLVGEASTGKGRSQQTFLLYDGSAVHISTRSYLTPNRVNLAEQGGLVPDIVVEPGIETDSQLEAAIKYLLDTK